MGSPPWGLTTLGFNPEDLQSIIADLIGDFQSKFGVGVPTDDLSINGKLIAIFAEREFNQWQVLQAVYDAFNPNAAQGVSLDNLCALIAITRNKAITSTVIVYLAGTGGTVIPAGSVIQVQNSNDYFAIRNAITLSAVGTKTITALTYSGSLCHATCASHGLNTGDVIFIYGASPNDYNGLVTVTFVDINTFTYIPITIPGSSPATGTIQFDFGTPGIADSIILDAINANAGALNIIVTPISGWTKVQNLISATLGNPIETDSQLRVRRISAFLGLGNATITAIEGGLLEVANVTGATVYENITDVTDVNSRPPHSIECLVQGGLPQDIGNKIFAKKAAGINTYGNQAPVTVIDSQGISHIIYFSRPSSITIALTVAINRDATKFPSTGSSSIQTAITEFIDSLGPGNPVYNYALEAIIVNLGLAGINSILITITSPSPDANGNVILTQTQVAVAGTITVNLSP